MGFQATHPDKKVLAIEAGYRMSLFIHFLSL